MTIQLDHSIVPSRHAAASAQRLAELLDVPWSAAPPIGPFSHREPCATAEVASRSSQPPAAGQATAPPVTLEGER